MSLILDALKKLDREKAARRDGTASIAVEILQSDRPRPAKRFLRYARVIAVTAIATAGVTYAVIVGLSVLERSSSIQTSVSPPAPARQAAEVATPRETAVSSKEEASPVPANVPVKAEEKPSAAPEAKKAVRALTAKKTIATPETAKKNIESEAKEEAGAHPQLKLSGIIWQEERSERRAMINGLVLREGSVIEGAKVIEIHPNHVRFSLKGRPFEINLGH